MALQNKFGNLPVGSHVIKFAIGVDEHKPCIMLLLSFVNGVQCSVQCKGTNTVFSKEGLEYLAL